MNFIFIVVFKMVLLNCLNSQATAKYTANMNPGIIIRLDQKTINSFKQAME